METSNGNISDTILQSINSLDKTPYSSSTFTSNNSMFSSNKEGSWFDSLQNFSWMTWLFIILILAFLGLNVFAYLAKGTDFITKLFSPITAVLFGTASTVVDVSAEGAKEIVGQAAGTTENTLTAIQDITPNAPKVKGDNYSKPKEDPIQELPINRELNNQQPQFNYSADAADSSIQGGGKSGWCYIGQDRGFRSCAEVGLNDTCMSGDIFPSHEICINPSLRS